MAAGRFGHGPVRVGELLSLSESAHFPMAFIDPWPHPLPKPHPFTTAAALWMAIAGFPLLWSANRMAGLHCINKLHASVSSLTTKVGIKGNHSKKQIGKGNNKKLTPPPLHFIVFSPFFPLVPVLHWLSIPLFTLLHLSLQSLVLDHSPVLLHFHP